MSFAPEPKSSATSRKAKAALVALAYAVMAIGLVTLEDRAAVATVAALVTLWTLPDFLWSLAINLPASLLVLASTFMRAPWTWIGLGPRPAVQG